MRSLFKVTFSFFLQNSELGYFQCICWKGSAVGNISHRTCLFFDLLKHGLPWNCKSLPFFLFAFITVALGATSTQASHPTSWPFERLDAEVQVEVRVEGVNCKNSLELLTSWGNFQAERSLVVASVSQVIFFCLYFFPWDFARQEPVPFSSSAVSHLTVGFWEWTMYSLFKVKSTVLDAVSTTK